MWPGNKPTNSTDYRANRKFRPASNKQLVSSLSAVSLKQSEVPLEMSTGCFIATQLIDCFIYRLLSKAPFSIVTIFSQFRNSGHVHWPTVRSHYFIGGAISLHDRHAAAAVAIHHNYNMS